MHSNTKPLCDVRMCAVVAHIKRYFLCAHAGNINGKDNFSCANDEYARDVKQEFFSVTDHRSSPCMQNSVRFRQKNIDLSLKSNPLRRRRKNYDAST